MSPAAIVGDAPQLEALRDELAHETFWGDGARAKTGWSGTFVCFQPATKRTAGGAEHGWVDFQLVVSSSCSSGLLPRLLPRRPAVSVRGGQ